jgi:hypothetical protein
LICIISCQNIHPFLHLHAFLLFPRKEQKTLSLSLCGPRPTRKALNPSLFSLVLFWFCFVVFERTSLFLARSLVLSADHGSSQKVGPLISLSRSFSCVFHLLTLDTANLVLLVPFLLLIVTLTLIFYTNIGGDYKIPIYLWSLCFYLLKLIINHGGCAR